MSFSSTAQAWNGLQFSKSDNSLGGGVCGSNVSGNISVFCGTDPNRGLVVSQMGTDNDVTIHGNLRVKGRIISEDSIFVNQDKSVYIGYRNATDTDIDKGNPFIRLHSLMDINDPHRGAMIDYHPFLRFRNAPGVEKGKYEDSDIRIKTQIQPSRNIIQTIRQVQPKEYTWLGRTGTDKESSVDIIAQELKEVFPEAVKIDKGYIFDIHQSFKIQSFEDQSIALEGSHEKITKDQNILVKINDQPFPSKILSVSANSFTIPKPPFFKDDEKEIYIQGTEVDDFHYVDKVKLGVLALGGVKELILENEQLKERLTQQEERLQRQELETESLKSQILLQQSQLLLLQEQMKQLLSKQ